MSDGMIINIPIRKHLRKFLFWKLKLPDDVIPLTVDDPIGFGMYLASLLSKKRDYLLMSNHNNIKSFITTIDYNCFIRVTLGQDYSNRAGMFIHEEKIYYINKFIEKQFRNEFNVFLHSNHIYNSGFVFEYGLDDFLSFCGITEDDIQKETLVKFFHRNKNNYSYINA